VADEGEAEVDETGLALAFEDFDRLLDVDGVADGVGRGWSMSVMSALVARPADVPSATQILASSRALSAVFINAPEPTLTSRSMACAPPAIFLLMMLEAMSAVLPNGGGDVAQGIDGLVGGDEVGGLGAHHQADALNLSQQLFLCELGAHAGDGLELVEGPPVKPSPRPDSLTVCMPRAAAKGATTRVVLSPTPPVECLSTVGPLSPERSSRSPETTMASSGPRSRRG